MTPKPFCWTVSPPKFAAARGRRFRGRWRADLAAKIVLAGGLDASNVREAIEAARPWGVDACSRIERAPGRKDHNKMKRFVEAALASTL